MKKRSILISIILLGQIFNGNAQDFYLGLNGGFLKNATLVEDYSPFRHIASAWKKERLNSLTWGVNAGYQLSKHWSIETQVQFVNLGYYERLDLLIDFHNGSTAGTILTQVDHYNYHNYIRFPLLANFNFFSNNSNFGISLLAGPNFGFLTKQTTKNVALNELSQNFLYTLDKQEIPLKKFDFGFQLGLRLKSKLYKSFSLFADGNIYQGFPSIINYPEEKYNRQYAYYEDLNIVNRHFTATIGIQYNFKTKRNNK